MFDDIPPTPNTTDDFKFEGISHAKLANKLSEKLNEPIYVVPRIYSDELISKKCEYLKGFNKELYNNIYLFQFYNK